MQPRDPSEVLDPLALFHYALAAFAAMVALVPALLLFVSYNLADPAVESTMRSGAERALGWATVALAGFVLLAGFAYAALLVVAGGALRQRKRWALCRAAALVSCLFLPFGTILGALTLVVLSRDDVRARFS
jgi:hypothetical protein